MSINYAWTCPCCGKQQNALPLDYALQVPDYWLSLSEEEKTNRGWIGTDICIVDGHFFVRGCIEIPVIGRDDKFVWGAWVSLSEESFKRVRELWNERVIENEPPKFGWLSNRISVYPDTLHLKTDVYLRGDNLRPLIVLEPTEHALAVEQREGISLARVEEIASALLHKH